MNTTNFQILKLRTKLILYGGIPGLLIFTLVVFGKKLISSLQILIAATLMFLILKIILNLLWNQKELRARQDRWYVDRPFPSIWDFLLVVLRFVGWCFIMFLVTTPIALFLRNIGLIVLVNWYFGWTVIFLWGFLYTSYSIFTTQYVVTEKDLLISFGLDKISISIHEIQTIEPVNNILNTLFYDILVSQSPLIVGVRVHNMLLLKRKNRSAPSSMYFSRIYITPSDPGDFLSILLRSKIDS